MRQAIIGVVGLVVVGCAGFAGLGFWVNSQNQRNYDTGHTAYLAGDCDAAIAAFNEVTGVDDPDSEVEITLKARAERNECQQYQEAAALAEPEPAAAILSFRDFLGEYPASPLAAQIRESATAIYAANAPADMVTADYCTSLDSIEEADLAVGDDLRPDLLYACGQALEDNQDYTGAVNFYGLFREEFPDHPQAEEVKEAFARAAIAEAEALGAGEIPAPQAVGGTGSGPGVIVIQNDTPDKISLVFSGPDVRVEELEACEECENFTEDPEACPELGPVGTYEVPAGTYSVVVKSITDDGVIPFRGQWDVAPGEEYYSCFFLVTQ